MITVDVEAFPRRAEKDHVERLIWGRYPDGCGGIGEMMDIADKHNVKLVMFLDFVEEFLYGEAIVEVARAIHARGHDLQLHSHPEIFPDSFWEERGLPRLTKPGEASEAQADALFAFLCERQMAATGAAPVAYRGGGYRFGPATVRAMSARGIRLNSSYVAASDNQVFQAGRLPQFQWDNGCVEAPISCLSLYQTQKKLYHLNFNHSTCTDAERMLLSLEAFYKQMGDQALAVLVMHSWSFSVPLENGYFSAPQLEKMQQFDQFLGLIAGKVEVVDSRAVLRLVDSGHMPVEGVVAVAAMEQGEAALKRHTRIAELVDRTSYFGNLPWLDRIRIRYCHLKLNLARKSGPGWGGRWRKIVALAAAAKSR